MFFQPPEEDKQVQSFVNKRSSRRKRKRNLIAQNNFKKGVFKKKNKLVSAMSAWAEQFTVAATWQIKHQLAYWKARAKSLEYENKLLHDIIRKNCLGAGASETRADFDSRMSQSSNSEIEEESEQEEDHDDYEVSEEFIEFLKSNAKYKEEARLERERLKTSNSEKSEVKEMEAGPSQPRTDRTEELKALYGDNWQRIAALEMSMLTDFINESDKNKPTYWPNIPFNFS